MSLRLRSGIIAIALTAPWMGFVPLMAHHSFAATYLEEKTITIEATVVQFLFRNPHSLVHVDAPEKRARPAVDRGMGLRGATRRLGHRTRHAEGR